MDITKSKFLKKYRNEAVDAILMVHPDFNKDEVTKLVEKKMGKDLKVPEAKLENSYTRENRTTNLLSVLDWAIDTKPIIASNATFFKQHEVGFNPNAMMLVEFLGNRKADKKKMFAIGDELSRFYKMFDLSQGNWKQLANSYYGSSGMKASAFYNKQTAPATTKSAQSVISTCETTFEAFLGNNFTFVDINEVLYWISVVDKEKCKLEDWVIRKSLDEVYERLSIRIVKATDKDREFLHNYLEKLDEDLLTRLYWKYNFIEFTKAHENIQKLYDDIFSSIRDFNIDKVEKEYEDEVSSAKNPKKKWEEIIEMEKFYDPNNPPKSIIKLLDTLRSSYMKYVYTRYMFTDRLYKIKNFPRNVVTVIDTDSNILSLDTWMEYCLSELKRGDYGRSKEDNVFIAVNTMCYVITAAITDNLLFYGESSNVAEEYRPRYSMKNEFFFANLILANVKKRYLSKIILREGHKLRKPKYDVKGFDFKKASTSEDASNFFLNTVTDLVLEPDHVDVKKLLSTLRDFRSEVKKSIEAGEIKYLPNGSAKELEAYDDPESEQGVRGAVAWNVIYPESAIQFPAKVAILKTNIYSLDTIKDLAAKEPEIYRKIKEGIFEDKTGFFVKRTKAGKLKVEGLSVLGIPTNEKIPEWILPYIDYATVINSVMAPFKSVTETFSIPSIDEGVTGRKTTGFTNIIKI